MELEVVVAVVVAVALALVAFLVVVLVVVLDVGVAVVVFTLLIPLPLILSTPPLALREGGVPGAEKRLAPGGAAPSPSRVPGGGWRSARGRGI